MISRPETLAVDEQPITVVHSSPLFTQAFQSHTTHFSRLRIADIYYSWSEFAPFRDFSSPWVLLDAFLDDHVPVLVKVRALAKIGSRPLVLGPLTPRQVSLLLSEGAAHVFSDDLTIPELTVGISAVMRSPQPAINDALRINEPCNLSDRELQILELYSRRRALQAAALGPALGLSPETVRVHLRNARKKLRLAGWPSSTRTDLAQALATLGWTITDEQWKQVGRW